MADRAQLLEAALDILPEGIALLSVERQVVFWNRSAEAITGYAGMDLLGRGVPEQLKALLEGCAAHGEPETDSGTQPGHGYLVRLQHKLGHDVQAMARILALRDGLGGQVGTAAVFHSAENLEALPHGESRESNGLGPARQNSKNGWRRCLRTSRTEAWPSDCCGLPSTRPMTYGRHTATAPARR